MNTVVKRFFWDSAQLVGRTSVGQATIDVLNINFPTCLEQREFLSAARRFPPE